MKYFVPREQVKHIADNHLADIRTKIANLKKMEHALRELSSNCYGENVSECPIIEALQAN